MKTEQPAAPATPPEFSYAYYRHILRTAQEMGYRISSFPNYDESQPRTLIMRHDVDYTINGVIDLARIEADMGATASYLFRVHANEYNLFSPHVYAVIQGLKALGHDVGLHFEAMTIGRAIEVPTDVLLRKEKKILEEICGFEVVTTSEHRDISHVVHKTPYGHDLHDLYEFGFKFYGMDPRYCKEMKYLSDSNGVWREGDPTHHLGKHDRFQVLIHPDWWFEKDLLLKGAYVHGMGNW